jgi:hypothetical protein
MKIGSEVNVRRLTRNFFEGGPRVGYFRPYVRVTDETSALEAELNHQSASGFMFSVIGQTEADTFHFEHPLLEAFCVKHGLSIDGPAQLSLDGDTLVLQAIDYHFQLVGDPYRIPFVPQMGTAEESAEQIYLAGYPEG